MKLNKTIWSVIGIAGGAFLMAPAQQAAAQSASAQAMLEEIVVTARRREENLQDLPLSIAAISAEAMEAQGIYSIEDVSDFVPNVTLTTSDRANNTRVVIRGIGGGHPDPVFVFGSGMYIDGHYIPNSLGGYMSTIDIERVELLRGPQGTLFGKNVTGGAVNIITAKPGPEFASSVTLRAAEGGQQDIRGMVNIPLGETVFARFGVAKETFDGYYFNQNLNITQGATDVTAINAAIRFTPNDNWTFDLSYNLQDRADDNKPIQCNPFDGSAPAWGTRGGARPDHLSRGFYPGYAADHRAACASDAAAGRYITSSDKYHFSDLRVNSGFATAQWNSGGEIGGLDDLNFKFNASFRETDYDYQQDRDGSFYDIDNIGMPVQYSSVGGDVGQDNDTNGWELLLEGQANERLDFTVGINYFHELARNGDGVCRDRFANSGYADIDPTNPTVPGEDGFGVVPNPASGDASLGVNCDDVRSGLYFDLLPGWFLPFINTSRIENESIGFFGHLTYALNDNWNLDVGARWIEDDRQFWNMESAISGCGIEEGPRSTGGPLIANRRLGGPIAANGSPMCDFTWDVSFQSAVLEGFYNQADDTFSEVTPMISLTRTLEGNDTLDSGMVYFLYSEGFLTGGFNTEINSNLPAIADYLSYGPESVSNIEIGFKGTFLDGRVQIMGDIFMMDYQDKQEDITIDNSDGQFGVDEGLGIRTNVASVDISGIEFEMRASPWDNGFVSLDVGLLDNQYGEFVYPDPADPSLIIDETNTTISDLTSEWTVNVGVEHAFTLANGASITPRLNFYSQDDYDYRAPPPGSPPSVCNQSSYVKVGARVTYLPAQANWRASLIGNNITDEAIYEFCSASRGVYRYRHERPAYWGLEFTADWGE